LAVPAGDGDGAALLQIGMPLVELMKQHVETGKQQQVAGPVNQLPRPMAPGEETAVIPWWVLGLRPYVGDLLKRAQLGKNPAVYADMVVEDFPDHLLPRVAELLAQPDFGQQFLSVFPQFSETVEIQQWIGEFFAAVRDAVVEDADGGDDVVEPTGEVVSA
jgi:hypothetical protein